MNDLCSKCGASWECEHRQKPAVRYIADLYGPPVAVEKPAEEVKGVELEDRIMAAVADRPGRDRDELARECKSTEARIDPYGLSQATDRFKATIKRLVKDKLLLETIHGHYYLFDPRLYVRDLKMRVESEERSVEWATSELAAAQKRLERRNGALAKLRAELNRAESLQGREA